MIRQSAHQMEDNLYSPKPIWLVDIYRLKPEAIQDLGSLSWYLAVYCSVSFGTICSEPHS